MKNEIKAGSAVGIDFGTSNSVAIYRNAKNYQYIEVGGKRLIPSAIFFKGKYPEQWLYGAPALKRGIFYPDALFKHFKRHIGETTPQIFRVEPVEKKIKRRYIIDTNIFLKEPKILYGLTSDTEILIPQKVYDELEKLKDKVAAAKIALKSVDEYPPQSIQLSDSDADVFNIAISNDDAQTILLTNDEELHKKIFSVPHKLQVQTYSEFIFFHQISEKINDDGTLKLTAKEGAALFLKYLRDEISKKIGYVNKAVITVPQEFSPIQNNEIKEAGLMAGFTEVELQTEPVAAAVAYGLDRKNSTILVYDLGGGTFDVTILRITDGNFERLVSGGNDKLGGEDFTQTLIKNFLEKLADGEILPDDAKLDLTDEDASNLTHEEFLKNRLKIWDAFEDIKCRLSTSDFEQKTFQLYVEPNEQVEIICKSTRENFEKLTFDLRGQTRKVLNEILQKAGLLSENIDAVIMAGGSSVIPSISQTVERFFGKKPYADRDPSTLIAEGAALFAALKWSNEIISENEIKIFDKTMNDLGVSLRGNIFNTIIPVNSPLPTEKTKIYSPVKDNQSELEIKIFVRDEDSTSTRTMDDGIKYIGKVRIGNLPPFKKDEVDVFVTFKLSEQYELIIDAILKNKNGEIIEKASVEINTTGI